MCNINNDNVYININKYIINDNIIMYYVCM